MRVGLVHGRFQPFHNGHKALIDKMLVECHLGVVLVGSADKRDRDNPFTREQRQRMIIQSYQEAVRQSRLSVGANFDLSQSSDSWDILLKSCVLSLTGYELTDVYAGPGYSLRWPNDTAVHQQPRVGGITASLIRSSLRGGASVESLADYIPTATLLIMKDEWHLIFS